MSTSTVPDLLQAAHDEGDLSAGALDALRLVDMGAQFAGGLGISIDEIEATQLVIVSVMPDDSGSIRFAGNSQAVCEGHNEVIESLLASKQGDQILFGTRYLNGFVLNAYGLLDNARRMDSSNYDPRLGTPLYDNSLVLLSEVLAKTQEAANAGCPVRSITLIVTDGHDEGSRRANAADVAKVVHDMLMTEQHIIAAMGIDDGTTDFRRVFKEMGIRDEWILTPANNQHEIRQAFAVFSKSAVRASQSAASFSQSALGGFAAP